MKILFYDVACAFAYDYSTLQQRALGGSEKTTLIIAHELAKQHDVTIAQHCRDEASHMTIDGVSYVSLSHADTLQFDNVILMRDKTWLAPVAKKFPGAKLYFWLTNLPPRDLFNYRNILVKNNYTIIAVSKFHQQVIQRRLQGKWYQRLLSGYLSNMPLVRTCVLYNPIPEDLAPDNTPWEQDQLLFMSSPYKGLEQVIDQFKKLREVYPELHLNIATHSPRDFKFAFAENDQIHFLGSLAKDELLQQLRRSFCVFYPQTARVETFGLVYAEANAAGTPVLAHDFGAAKEVLSDPSQLVNGHDMQAIAAKMAEWRAQRPVLQANPQFRLSHVMQAWERVLG